MKLAAMWVVTTVKLAACAILLVVVGFVLAQAPTQPLPKVGDPPPKLVLTETENLRLENLKLRRQVLLLRDAQLLANFQAQPAAQQLKAAFDKLDEEIAKSTKEILKAHGNPPEMVFDQQLWQFRAKTPAELTPAKPAETKSP